MDMIQKSPLQEARATYSPHIPDVLRSKSVQPIELETLEASSEITELFPHIHSLAKLKFEVTDKKIKPHRSNPMNVGVLLSGGQAPGGHNVICGLYDGVKSHHDESKLYGFLMGPDGLIKHQYIELTQEIVDEYRNTGGFDMIGSSRTKLEKVEHFNSALEILHQLRISALVIIGGDDSCTNAAMLAEYYASIGEKIAVIGCPKTIDGDLKNIDIETSFGFDTATKIYSELIGNIQRDCSSSKKYWHFIKLMGRSASHITLECALKTQPSATLISEEVQSRNLSLDDVVTYIADVVAKRAEKGYNYGTVLIPEGLIEFMPAMKSLISELNDFLGKHWEEFTMIKRSEQIKYVTGKLSSWSAAIFSSLPQGLAHQLILDRDPHGNVKLSLIETEKLLADMVDTKLRSWEEDGRFNGKFSYLTHFFGYEGRCAMPSNFDANYCYAIGLTATLLASIGANGYMAIIKNTYRPTTEWLPMGIPLTSMMGMAKRSGQQVPVISRSVVDLEGNPFQYLLKNRDMWAQEDAFLYPGPIQYYGPEEISDQITRTLHLEYQHD